MSPTSVAAPSRLEATAIAMIDGTGLIFSFLAIVRAIGATIRTVATLSTKAEMSPAKTASEMTAHLTFGVFWMILSAIRAGIFDSMKSETSPIVPKIIRITFHSIEAKT